MQLDWMDGWLLDWMDGWMHGWMLHSLCAFLLYSGTVCVHFYYVQALSVCISIISPTVFQHFLRAFPLFLRAFSACISIVLDCLWDVSRFIDFLDFGDCLKSY